MFGLESRRRRREERALDAQPDLTDYEEKKVLPVSDALGGAAGTPDERPLVFASNKHEGVYIYEYSDRLEFYVKTNTGMVLHSKVYKQ